MGWGLQVQAPVGAVLVAVKKRSDEIIHERNYHHQEPDSEHYDAGNEQDLGFHNPHNHANVQKTDREKR